MTPIENIIYYTIIAIWISFFMCGAIAIIKRKESRKNLCDRFDTTPCE